MSLQKGRWSTAKYYHYHWCINLYSKKQSKISRVVKTYFRSRNTFMMWEQAWRWITQRWIVSWDCEGRRERIEECPYKRVDGQPANTVSTTVASNCTVRNGVRLWGSSRLTSDSETRLLCRHPCATQVLLKQLETSFDRQHPKHHYKCSSR